MPGRGRMKTTGTLGDVMKESIDAAASYVRSIAPEIGVKPPRFDRMDIHVHVPSGAIPKDGPSAGVTMLTAIVSLLTDINEAVSSGSSPSAIVVLGVILYFVFPSC